MPKTFTYTPCTV